MNAASPADRYPTVIGASALALLGLMVLALAAAPLYTEDLWWHLKAGEMYATEGPWPAADWMLHTARDDAPIQHEWLFGVATYGLERALGFQGLRVVHAAAVVTIVWLAFSIFRRAGAWTTGACFATCVFLILAWFRLFQFRPDLFSILATLAGYRLLLERGEPPSWPRIAAYALLITVWANVHSLFLVSLNLLVAALLGVALAAVMDRHAGSRDGETAARRRALARRLGAALAVGLVVGLLNPRGIGQHLTFLTSSGETAIWHVTDEWSHFNPFVFAANHDTVAFPVWLVANAVLLAFVLTAGTALWRYLRAPGPGTIAAFDPVRFGLGLAAVVAILVSIRFLWMCVFPLIYVLHAFADRRDANRKAFLGAAWTMALASVVLAAWFSVGYGFGNLVTRFAGAPGEYFSMPYRSHKFHSEGVQLLAEAGLEGNLFNAYYMGGFLGYWLSPRLRTFVDSRAEHYDREVWMDYSAVTEMLGRKAGETFLDVLDRREVDIFFGVGFPGWWHPVHTTGHLDRVEGWIPISRSFRHGIYLRDDPSNRENLDRVAAYYAMHGVPFSRERGLDPGAVIRANPRWAIEHSMLPEDYFELLAAAESADPSARLAARNALGLVYQLTGADDLQLAWDAQTAAAFPADRRSRARLVYGSLRTGRVDAAQIMARELLALDARDPASRELAKLVSDYRRLGSPDVADFAGRDLQVHRNHLLWKKLPATVPETWAVEMAMPTEALDLSRAPPREEREQASD